MDAIFGEPMTLGKAAGPVLACDTALSFWGGVDPATGIVIDTHHPLHGSSLKGSVLVIPSSRGSCSGSGVLMELMLNGHAPAALVFLENEEILTLGAIVAKRIFGLSLPIVRINAEDYGLLAKCECAFIEDGTVYLAKPEGMMPKREKACPADLALTELDEAFLAGRHGRAAQAAMEIIVEAAGIYSAGRLHDVGRAHIDGCIYTGEAGLRFAETLVDWGGLVKIPTTLNAISVDYDRWKTQGVAPSLGTAASRLADAYVAMGARPTFTCAPYLLDDAPMEGEQIVWAESNAVVFANSVLGARTMKYPDYLDICIALTGRAPWAGCHLDKEREPQFVIEVSTVPDDDAFYPLLGYHAGKLAGARIPLIVGLENAPITRDDLKAFGAAFATTSAAPMFHISGVTPEARHPDKITALRQKLPQVAIARSDLAESWQELNGVPASQQIGLVALGNPHFSAEEIAAFAALCKGKIRHPKTNVMITCGRDVYRRAVDEGSVGALEAFGVTFVTDTCWCMIGDPVIPREVSVTLTNSGKYAHYGSGLSGRSMRFGSLAQCATASEAGEYDSRLPEWLAE
ncbi:DUF521 domain-containing protein [Rhizobium sp. XQZ8]|uniref:cis-3-hydroxy-L-proline dehydratase n=1 Tax=Rhizobium populisoli TaxID=2859785 RepID=UPI001CA5A9DB|nr:aconitase X [Rhizobium populisoli]MBW6422468.1 DUF521 domain-containing protein [Rhizobium populisoli]